MKWILKFLKYVPLAELQNLRRESNLKIMALRIDLAVAKSQAERFEHQIEDMNARLRNTLNTPPNA